MAWLSGWDYRKELTIEGSTAGVQTNYQIRIPVYYGSYVFEDSLATSTSGFATANPHQSKSFYAAGLLWQFYSDGTNLLWKTATDMYFWSSPSTLAAGTNGYFLCLYYDDTYIHYVRINNYGPANTVYYRRGTPQTDGTISWSAAEQTVATAAAGHSYIYPYILVDSNGYPWIGISYYEDSWATHSIFSYAWKADDTDGTFVIDVNHNLYEDTSPNTLVTVVVGCPLTGGKVYWTYPLNDSPTWTIKGVLYNAGWGATETITTGAAQSGTMIPEGDDIHYTWLGAGASNLGVFYQKYTSGSWGAATQVSGNTNARSFPASSLLGNNTLFVAYSNPDTLDHIYYSIKRDDDTWDAEVDWIDESTDGLTGSEHFSCMTNGTSPIGQFLAYSTKTSSPYTIKTALLPVAYPTLDSHAQADFDDLRFTTNDGTTNLSYWIEYKVNSEFAYVWVKVDSIAADPNTTTIYIYYGNAGAAAASSGADTFIAFDDFEWGSNGDPIDDGDWVIDNGDVDISTEQAFAGGDLANTRSMKLIGAGGGAYPAAHLSVGAGVVTDNVALRFRYYKENATVTPLFAMGDGSNCLYARVDAGEDIEIYDGAAWQDEGGNVTADSWTLIEFNNFDWTASTCDLWVDDALIASGIDISTGFGGYEDQIYHQGSVTATEDVWVDDQILRNWTPNEPIWNGYNEQERQCINNSGGILFFTPFGLF